MASIAKVITIIGSSPESFAKAADAAVQEASKTLRGIKGVDVISMSAEVEGDRHPVNDRLRLVAVDPRFRPTGAVAVEDDSRHERVAVAAVLLELVVDLDDEVAV